MTRRRALVLGAAGQLGHELTARLRERWEVDAPTRDALDLVNLDAVRARVTALRPDCIVNAAAYTAVDLAESDVPACTTMNADLPAALAQAAEKTGALLVHFSSDYVFDGAAHEPYAEDADTSPLNVYGTTKVAGEKAIAATECAHLVFRTSWVYSARRTNFARRMLQLAREREELRVVNDQVGTPNSAAALAGGVLAILDQVVPAEDRETPAAYAHSVRGVYHLTSTGRTSWHGFAAAVLALDPGRELHRCRRVLPIRTADFPTAARRPAFSVLDGSRVREVFGVVLPDWKDALADAFRADPPLSP